MKKRDELDLAAIEARLTRATPGPWLVKDQDPKQIHRGTVQVQENGRGVEVIAECYCGAYDGHGLRNAELIANAPTDLAALIEEVRHLRARAEKAEANYAFMVERAADQHLDGYRELGARAAAAENEADRLRARLREVAQVLIAEVGASGPMDAEDAARKAVAEVVRLREENELLRKDLNVAYLHRIAKQGKDGAHTLNFQFAANTIKVGEHRSNKALPLW